MPPELKKAVIREDATVEINDVQVDAIAAVLRKRVRDEVPTPARWDDPLFWNVDASPEDRCQYLAIGNAINFRFWHKSDGKVVPSTGIIHGQRFRGSMYLWRRLRCAVQRKELLLEADFLARLTQDQFVRALADDEGQLPLAPGMVERVANLRDLGARLEERWGGQFVSVIQASSGSLERFAELCTSFRAFDDPVRKLTMVNAIMLTGSKLASFDRDPLPGVDYHLVKQALRQGLVRPSGRLRTKLVSRDLLDADESLALRGAVLSALVDVAHRAGISTAVIDNLYWLNRRVCGDEQWLCSSCPFAAACSKRTEYGLPLELTRYY